MKRKFICLCLLCAMLFTILPFQSSAAESRTVINYADGSYMEIILSESFTRATNSKSGQKTHNYYDSNGNLDWKAVLTGSFTYNGSTATCTSSSCSLTIYDSDWYQVSKSTSRSGNSATTELTMGYKVLGVTITKRSYTITLSCDANGNLS